MIEYSSEGVNPNTVESLLLISMLLVFALLSSGYVLKKVRRFPLCLSFVSTL